MEENLIPCSVVAAAVAAPAWFEDGLRLRGKFHVEVRDPEGNVVREEDFYNMVVTQGKNDLLDKYLGGSGYTAAFYMGLISDASFTAIAAGDTAAQINGTNGWKEAGNANDPKYGSTRDTCVFAAASGGSKALSAALTFTISTNVSAAKVKGAFLATTSAVDGTTGVLLSAGLFTGGDLTVLAGYIVSVSWSLAV